MAVQAAGEPKLINGKRGTPVQTDNCFLREDSPRARAVHFRAGSGYRTGSSGRFGGAGLEGRGALTVLVRGLTCDCSPKGAQHLRTIEILQADIVKKAIGHIVSIGLTTRHGQLSQRNA